MPIHLGGDPAHTLSRERKRTGLSTDRKTSLLRDRPAKGVRSSAPYRIWVSDAAHHCVQLRVDLLFTMSDNLHRVIEDRRDTNSSSWTDVRSRRQPRLVEPDGIEPTTSCLQS